MSDEIRIIGDEILLDGWYVANFRPDIPASIRADAEDAMTRDRDKAILELEGRISFLQSETKRLRAELKAAKAKGKVTA